MSIMVKFILVAATLAVLGVLMYLPNFKNRDLIGSEEALSPSLVATEDTTQSQEETVVSEMMPSPALPESKSAATGEPEEIAVSIPMPLPPVIPPVFPDTGVSAINTLLDVTATSTASEPVAAEPPLPILPPLNEEALLRAVVKIQCPAANNQGIYVGAGFVVGSTTVVTAAHVVMNSATTTCDVIFPRERKPIQYLRGVTEDLAKIKKRHDEEGIDMALLTLPPFDSYPEAQAIFGNTYPSIPYPICENPALLKDTLLHFGYPSNFKDQSYLSKLDGEVVVFADIAGVEDQLSLDQTVVHKTPIFSYTNDVSQMHPYIVSRVPSFYGDSGGLAFNKTKQCILGPHRGGTIGKASGENYTIFINMGWWSGTEDIFTVQ